MPYMYCFLHSPSLDKKQLAQDDHMASRQYDANLSSLEAHYIAERAQMTTELSTLKEQYSRACAEAAKLSELEVIYMGTCT